MCLQISIPTYIKASDQRAPAIANAIIVILTGVVSLPHMTEPYI